MGHLGLCSAIILLGFAFLSTSADDRVYSQGISYQTTFALHVKPLGASQYVDTNLFQDVGDRLMSAGAVGVTNMNTYLIKYRFKIKQYDNLDNVVDSIESETKFGRRSLHGPSTRLAALHFVCRHGPDYLRSGTQSSIAFFKTNR